MKSKSNVLWVILICFVVVSACAFPQLRPTQNSNQPLLNRDAADRYSASFILKFTGASSWTYQLATRKSSPLHETSLQIEGLPSTMNPGDIRLVTDNETTWMIGEGTDQQCVQFPTGKGMDPSFIFPESLVSISSLGSALELVGEEQLDGVAVLHFRATGAASGPWKNVNVDLVQEKASGMLRQFTMTAIGEDPFFAAGAGTLNASYLAGPLDNPEILAVTGCEVSVPLPEAIHMFVRLPGLASFESQSNPADLVSFFQTALPQQSWVEKEPPAQTGEDTVLSYQRGEENVEIHIEVNPAGGSMVEMLFLQEP